jgi:hypothetical protein
MAMQYRRPKHFPGHMFHDYYHRLLGAGFVAEIGTPHSSPETDTLPKYGCVILGSP